MTQRWPKRQTVEEAIAEYRAMQEDAQRLRWLIGNSAGVPCHPDSMPLYPAGVPIGPETWAVRFPHIFAEQMREPSAKTWEDCVREAIDDAIGIDEATRKGEAMDADKPAELPYDELEDRMRCLSYPPAIGGGCDCQGAGCPACGGAP